MESFTHQFETKFVIEGEDEDDNNYAKPSAEFVIEGDEPNNPIANELLLGCIYKLKCIATNKCYIGQTHLYKMTRGEPSNYGIYGRWSDHRSDALTAKKSYPLFQAIRDHPNDNDFEGEILAYAPMEQLGALEWKYMIQYNTLVPNGYNGNSNVVVTKRPSGMTMTLLNFVNRPDAYIPKNVNPAIGAIIKMDKRGLKEIMIEARITEFRIMNIEYIRLYNGKSRGVTIVQADIWEVGRPKRLNEDRYRPECIKQGGVKESLNVSYTRLLDIVRRITQGRNIKVIDEVKIT